MCGVLFRYTEEKRGLGLTCQNSPTDQAAATILSSTSVTAEAEVAAEAIIRTNLDAITSSINATIATVVQATGAATGTVITAASGLTQAEIDMLTNDLVIIVGILTNLNATVTAVANVEAAAGILFGGEITALQRVIQPFLSPILVFAQAVYSVSVGVTVSGLANAVVGVYTILGNLESSIGLADLH